MPEFRLTQISDTHLTRRLTRLTGNFHRLSEHIDATRPDLIINSGDVAFDGPTNPADLDFAKSLHDALPVACRYLPGNHDIGCKPLALFLHKPLYLNAPEDPELEATSIRYVPQPARRHLIGMLRGADLRLVASGHVHQRRDFTFAHLRHVWAPSAGFVISDARQERIGVKEVGLVEYRFQPDRFEVRYVKAPGQIDVDLDELLADVPAA
jgi:hypothetical protein